MIRKLTLEDLELRQSIFKDFYYTDSVIEFKKESWSKMILENLFLIEEDNIGPFFNILRYTKSPGIIIMPILNEQQYKTKNIKRATCIEFLGIPSKEEFKRISEEEYYTFTGGIIISLCNKVAAFSEIDNSLLYIGYENSLAEVINTNFDSNNQYLV